MAFRFRRSIRLAPGVRLNVGKRGLSVSAGIRGASVTLGAKGVHGNVGIPGTGISYGQNLSLTSSKPSNTIRARKQDARLQRELDRLAFEERRREALASVKLSTLDDGSLHIEDANGEPLSRKDLKLLWEQKGEVIKQWIETRAREINGDSDLIAEIHLDTPDPRIEPSYQIEPFLEEPPARPLPEPEEPKPILHTLKPLGFFKRLFKKNRQKHELQVRELERNFEAAMEEWHIRSEQKVVAQKKAMEEWQAATTDWERRKDAHQEGQRQLGASYPSRIRTDVELMGATLSEVLESLVWPRETTISFDISDDGAKVWLDVDLPEIEDLPPRIATVASTERRLNIKDKPKTQLQKEYAAHIHGIAFRLAGAVLSSLPGCQALVVSGYSQRLDKATGNMSDDYLLSVVIDRERFSNVNFDGLERVDPVATLEMFDLRRRMTTSGFFKPIEPFAPESLKINHARNSSALPSRSNPMQQ